MMYLDKMNNMYLKLYSKYQELLTREEGQDLVEYALLVALISVAAVAVLPGLGSAISSTFNTIKGDL